MGGLLARAALHRHPALAERVKGAVHVCQPVHGAVVLYRRFFTGVRRPYDAEVRWADRLFSLILGNTPPRFRGNICGLPGPLQLLPTGHYEGLESAWWIDPHARTDPFHAMYSQADYPPALSPTDADPYVRRNILQRHRELREFHEAVHPGIAFPNSWSVYGTGLATETAVGFDGRTVRRQKAPGEGDGTVPAFSGSARLGPGGQVVAVPEVEHATACTAEAVHTEVGRILGGLP
jgi:hypothetical protein